METFARLSALIFSLLILIALGFLVWFAFFRTPAPAPTSPPSAPTPMSEGSPGSMPGIAYMNDRALVPEEVAKRIAQTTRSERDTRNVTILPHDTTSVSYAPAEDIPAYSPEGSLLGYRPEGSSLAYEPEGSSLSYRPDDSLRLGKDQSRLDYQRAAGRPSYRPGPDLPQYGQGPDLPRLRPDNGSVVPPDGGFCSHSCW